MLENNHSLESIGSMPQTSLVLSALFCASVAFASAQKPNILFITMDDMNWDSMGSYGSPVEDITPHMDSLAAQGMRFHHAFVQSSTCAPSRNVLHTGRYPHVSGMHGFYSVKFPHNTVPEYLREAGYFTGVVQKVPDSTPTNDFDRYWHYHKSLPTQRGSTPVEYAKAFEAMVTGAKVEGKPFYAVINVIDPHLPFYNGPMMREQSDIWDQTSPSRVYSPDEVPVPGFLHGHPAFAQEVADYYSTVRRGDDCVGAVLDVLRQHGLEDDTIIIFLSDHGMSMPFAKSTLYPAGVRTPWIVVWPGVAEPGYLDAEHMISAIDYMPTILDIIGAPVSEELEGRSIVPLIRGEQQADRNRVFVQLNENPNATVRPIRGIYTRDFVYIFNPWSNGDRIATMEARWYRSWQTMKELAGRDPLFAERFDFLKYRTTEELYAYSVDPDALNNLIDNPHYRAIADQLRGEMESWMDRTDDYVLPAFLDRENSEALEAFFQHHQAIAHERAKDTEWKRTNNHHGSTAGHSKYYDPNQ
ncbi:MAG: heparan N-sulfatase [Puniceicoccaceae bacterium]|nr:MAG: heparan N-sulfatase [Puniceicoccaceae bacterium]